MGSGHLPPGEDARAQPSGGGSLLFLYVYWESSSGNQAPLLELRVLSNLDECVRRLCIFLVIFSFSFCLFPCFVFQRGVLYVALELTL